MASMRKGKSFNETTCVQRKPQYIRTLSAILVSLCTLNIIQTKKPEKKTILHSTWEYSLYLLFYLKRTSNWISLKWLRGCRWVTFSLSFATPHRFPTLKFIPLNIILKKQPFWEDQHLFEVIIMEVTTQAQMFKRWIGFYLSHCFFVYLHWCLIRTPRYRHFGMSP